MIEDIIKDKASLFADGVSTELRAQENREIRIRMQDGTITANTKSSTSGVNARVCKNGVYGFSSSADYTPQAAESVLKAATENALFLNSHAPKNKTALPQAQKGNFTVNKIIEDTDSKYYTDVLKELDNYVTSKCKDIKSRSLTVSEDSMDKIIYTSDGYCGHHTSPRSYIYITLTGESKDSSPIQLFEPLGGFGNFKENFTDPSKYFNTIDKLYEKVMHKREGVYAEAGLKTVILGGDLSGMIAHEAVGHTVEADLVFGGSVAGPNLNRMVASPIVNLTDFAHTAFGKAAPLPVYVDDEGILAQDAPLIKDGMLVGYMHNRESAQHFGVAPCGNARAWDFSDEPIIRMRNTAVHPGKDKLEDMIASVDDGYYLINTGNGQADATGEFMFSVNMGYEIKNGKLGRPILDTTVSGIAFEMLKTVEMVSDQIEWTGAGFCGKKQWIPVGMGGPAMKCKIMIGGR